MVDYPADWRRALELLAGSAEGYTALILVAQGFPSTVIARLVDSGLVAAATKRVLADQSTVDVTRFIITPRGRATLERVTVPAPNERGRLLARRWD
jgi:hypothetical protein